MSRIFQRIDRLRRNVGWFVADTGIKLKLKLAITERKRGSSALASWKGELWRKGFRQIREQYWLLAYPEILEIVGEPQMAMIVTAVVGRLSMAVVRVCLARLKVFWNRYSSAYCKRLVTWICERVTIFWVRVPRRSKGESLAANSGESTEPHLAGKRVIVLILDESKDRTVP